MLPRGTITRRLAGYLREKGSKFLVEEVVPGLSYMAVRLSGGSVGLAALQPPVDAGIADSPRFMHIRGRKASEVLELLTSGESLAARALGLATANAVISPGVPEAEPDTLDLMALSPGDRVAMVGFFPPLLDRIRGTGAELAVVERDPRKPGMTDPGQIARVLKECSVAIITATTLLNDTIEDVLNALGRPRHVALLGPSTPACPEAFHDTGIHHLGGAAVMNEREVLRVVAEGGGTPALRHHLRFWNIPVDRKAFPGHGRKG
jgi:hypothetical protein